MGKFGTFLARSFAVLFSIAFVVLAILALLLFNVDRRLLNASTYKNVLSGQQVYERLPRILAEQLVMSMDYNPCAQNPLVCEGASVEFQDCVKRKLNDDARYTTLSAGEDTPTQEELNAIQPCLDQFGANLQPNPDEQAGGPPPFMQSLSVTDWETIIGTLVPAEELKSLAETTLDEVFAYLGGEQETASISLVSLKDHITSQAGVDAVLTLIRAQPACTPEQTAQMLLILEGAQGEMSLCRPPEETLATMTPLILAQLTNFTATLPDQQILLSPESGENSNGPLGNLGGQTRILRFVLRASPDLPLLMLLFISLFAVRSARGWLRWWGIPFFLTGLLALVLTFTAASSFEQVWLSLLAEKIPAYLSLGIASLAHDLLRALTQSLLTGVRVGALLLGLAGLGMWGGSYFIKPKPTVKPQPEPVA